MEVNGEVDFARRADLRFTDGAQSMTVSGPLEKPTVTVRRAQAASNPPNAEEETQR
jgi:hypothetical protein